jgi:hypothetical protein
MIMPPGLRKLALAVHLTCSVGWLGAVVTYLALDLTVSTSQDPQLVRAVWIAMGVVTSSTIVPLALASLLTGLVMSLGTKWGLFRHWWVLISLVLTVVATLVLLSEAGLIGRMPPSPQIRRHQTSNCLPSHPRCSIRSAARWCCLWSSS